MEQNTKRVFEVVRCDLCFAMAIFDDEIESSGAQIYNRRLQHGVDMITDLLGDHEDFKKLQERWAKE